VTTFTVYSIIIKDVSAEHLFLCCSRILMLYLLNA
jgi:hypothetical protein